MRIPFEEMKSTLKNLFQKCGFSVEKADILADGFSSNSLAGVNSHGINRVAIFTKYVKKGLVDPDADAEKVESFGCLERWDGKMGAGIINGRKCTSRAIEIAKKHGMGLVALRNTNHWMRGGAFGWQAANEGCIGIFFTNTQPNMPPWGGKDSKIGNNPFIVAIPRKEGHVVLDMALSQFSFGKIHSYKLRDELLPFPGGWDENDQLSNDPNRILTKERGLPVGYWKGSAFSMILDMLVTVLSAGNSTFRIGEKNFETAISQVFLCIDPSIYHDQELQNNLLNEIIDFSKSGDPMNAGDKVYYPGERSLRNVEENLRDGIEVDDGVWKKILELLVTRKS